MTRSRLSGGNRGETPDAPPGAASVVVEETAPASDTERPPAPGLDVLPGEDPEDVPARVDTKVTPAKPKRRKAQAGHRWVVAKAILRREDGDVPPGTELQLPEADYLHFVKTGAVAELLD